MKKENIAKAMAIWRARWLHKRKNMNKSAQNGKLRENNEKVQIEKTKPRENGYAGAKRHGQKLRKTAKRNSEKIRKNQKSGTYMRVWSKNSVFLSMRL